MCVVCSVNPAFSNSPETENYTSVYSELDDVHGDHYDVIGLSTAAAGEETGYMVPDENGSPSPMPYYMVPLPTPPPSYYNFKLDPTATGEDWSSNGSTEEDSGGHSSVSEANAGAIVTHVDRPTNTSDDETGYMVPVEDGSPGPRSNDTMPLAIRAPSCPYNDVRQDPNATVVDATDCVSPDANSEYQAPFFGDDATANKDYANEFEDKLQSADSYTPLQLQDNAVDSSSTEVVPVSRQLSDSD